VFFASPTARGGATMVRTRLRHVLTGAVMEKSFRSSEKFAEPDVELVPASFLYQDAEGCHFMDEKSFEQFVFANEDIGGDRGYLKDGLSLQVLKYNGAPVSLQLPQYVELAVTSTSRVCAATRPPAAPANKRRWKPASWCACRCSLKKANSCG
jgi:elongation factor P